MNNLPRIASLGLILTACTTVVSVSIAQPLPASAGALETEHALVALTAEEQALIDGQAPGAFLGAIASAIGNAATSVGRGAVVAAGAVASVLGAAAQVGLAAAGPAETVEKDLKAFRIDDPASAEFNSAGAQLSEEMFNRY
jgi:hypothetical protein